MPVAPGFDIRLRQRLRSFGESDMTAEYVIGLLVAMEFNDILIFKIIREFK